MPSQNVHLNIAQRPVATNTAAAGSENNEKAVSPIGDSIAIGGLVSQPSAPTALAVLPLCNYDKVLPQPKVESGVLKIKELQRASACNDLRKQLKKLDRNEVLRDELQTVFIAELLSQIDFDSSVLEVFERRF